MFIDIDECGLDNGGCDQNCTNTLGSFFCNCSEGYLLDENGFTCDGARYACASIWLIHKCSFFQTLTSVSLIHVTPMQHVITLLVALAAPVSVVILEMAFSVLVSVMCK